jgi:hypothetical protein
MFLPPRPAAVTALMLAKGSLERLASFLVVTGHTGTRYANALSKLTCLSALSCQTAASAANTPGSTKVMDVMRYITCERPLGISIGMWSAHSPKVMKACQCFAMCWDSVTLAIPFHLRFWSMSSASLWGLSHTSLPACWAQTSM